MTGKNKWGQMTFAVEENEKMKKINCKECVFSPFKQWSENRVGVIRCKDCKYWSPYPIRVHTPIIRGKERIYWVYGEDNDVGYCQRTGESEVNAVDFCSKGEKKDE